MRNIQTAVALTWAALERQKTTAVASRLGMPKNEDTVFPFKNPRLGLPWEVWSKDGVHV